MAWSVGAEQMLEILARERAREAALAEDVAHQRRLALLQLQIFSSMVPRASRR